MKKYLYLGCMFGILNGGVFGKTTITFQRCGEDGKGVEFACGEGEFRKIKLGDVAKIEDLGNCEIEFKNSDFGREIWFDPTRLSDDGLIIKNTTDFLLRFGGSFKGKTVEVESDKFLNDANVVCDKKINIKSKKFVNYEVLPIISFSDILFK